MIPRYFLWPYPSEVLTDIQNMGANPINGFRATSWLRDISAWTENVLEFTFPTIPWDNYHREMTWGKESWDFPVVMKTREKSFKEQWSTSMYAASFSDAKTVFANIVSKGIDPEDIFVRKFEKLMPESETFEGMCPQSEEYRFFVLDGEVLQASSYWPDSNAKVSDVPKEFVSSIIGAIRDRGPTDLRFYVLDIALREDGTPVLVEVNDGCTSGLCNINPREFYTSLQEKLS